MELTIDISGLGVGDNIPVSARGDVLLPDGFGHVKKGAVAEVRFDGHLSREDLGRILASGSIKAKIPALCARCLHDAMCEVGADVREVFSVKVTDIDEWPIMDNRIDLSPAMSANILSAMPMRILCDSAECSVLDSNNEGNSLGGLANGSDLPKG